MSTDTNRTRTSREGIDRAATDWRRAVKKRTGHDIGQEAARRRVAGAVRRGQTIRDNGNR